MSLKEKKLQGNGQMDRIFKTLEIKLTLGVHVSLPWAYIYVYEGGSESSVTGVITLLIEIIGCCIIP